MIQGRPISKGRAKAELLLLNRPFSFLGGVDPSTGKLNASAGHGGEVITGRVFAFPAGRGSTVGSYTILQMRRMRTLPAAIVNSRAETIVATGAVMAGVPMIDGVDLSLLKDGDSVVVDGDAGTLELEGVDEKHVVTSILLHGDKILILKRSDKVGTYQRLWAGVSGFMEEGEAPIDTANKEIVEETGFRSASLIKEGQVQAIRSRERIWHVHPFLFRVDRDDPTIDWEHTEYRWVAPADVPEYDTVPGFVRVLRALGL